MLKSVYIKNYALVEESEIHFEKGLNILTGETGAGKSILIGAIGAILGERTSPSMLRSGAQKAVIEGVFDLSENPAVLELLREKEYDIDDDTVIVRREISSSGRSRAFLNDTPATLEDIAQVAARLVDLHGQHEHQSLLRVSEHLEFLDTFADVSALRRDVAEKFSAAESLRQDYEKLLRDQQHLKEKKDYLEFQLAELERVDPKPGEEQELEQEEKQLAHSTEIIELAGRISALLYEGDASAQERISAALADLNNLVRFVPSLEENLKELESALIIVQESAQSVQEHSARIEIDPARLEQVQNRLAEISFLKKKYALSYDLLVERVEELRGELRQVESIDEQVHAAEKAWAEAIRAYRAAATALSRARKDAGAKLEKVVPELLSELGMQHATFEVRIDTEPAAESWLELGGEPVRASRNGYDRVEFFISTNPGHPVKPLARVASGGEVSRIMLALKSAGAHTIGIPCLIFDEIDNGISGRIAQAVGRKLRYLARNHQILCITHLPQIASAGSTHFMVEKSLRNGETISTVRKLDESEREEAVAMLLAGDTLTESHLSSARELLKQAHDG